VIEALRLVAGVLAAVALALFGLGVFVGFACAFSLPRLQRWASEQTKAPKPAPLPRVPPVVLWPVAPSGKDPRPS